MRIRTASFVSILLCFVPSIAQASPWTPAPGHGYAKLWLRELPGWSYHDGAGHSIDLGAYDELSLSAYGEVGIAEGFAVSLHAPLARSFFLENTRTGALGSYVVPGDPTLSLRWRFLKLGRFVAAVQVGARFPFAPSGIVQPVYARDAAHALAGGLELGTGVFDFESGLSFGYGWDRVYLAGSATFVARTGGWDQVLSWSIEAGMNFDAHFSGRIRVVGWHPIVRGSEPQGESPSGVANGTEYTGVGVEGEYWLDDHWAIGGALEGGLVAVHRQIGGPVIDLYVAAKW